MTKEVSSDQYRNSGREPEVTSLILGAGFSCVAGLPLAKDLFNTSESPKAFSKTAVRRNEKVLHAWRNWSRQTGSLDAEIWLRELYLNEDNDSGITFQDAVEFAVARLVILPDWKWRSTPYFYGITRSVECETHRILVTMNYDILAEQGLKEKYSSHHRSPPLCHYGGFPANLHVRMMLDLRTRRYRNVKLGEEISIFKMLGSVNWCDEPHDFKIHDDVRGVFRSDRRRGKLAIVPPLPEKRRPEWLEKVWQYAENGLKASHIWIVCGYSMPEYDDALRRFFKRVASQHDHLTIYILDPNATSIVSRWREISPEQTQIVTLSGLPEGIDELEEIYVSRSST